MLSATIGIAAAVLGVGFWSMYRWWRPRPLSVDHGAEPTSDVTAARASPDTGKIAAANALVTERLWRLAFAAPALADTLQKTDLEIRDRVYDIMSVDRLDAKYFPRRPALMPQLMRAIEDPRAATQRLSRMVAHDPVLAADVLRLANSSRFRTSAQPIETIQRAIVVVGVDALRGLLAVAMMQPVFRAARSNFPRFPRMLWERTERAARAAEAYVMRVNPQDRFEAQLAILLSALGPLVVYGATLDAYARCPGVAPNPALCVTLTSTCGMKMALRIAHNWETAPRLAAAIGHSSGEPLAQALCVGELLGTVSLLLSQQVIDREEALEVVNSADLSSELLGDGDPVASLPDGA